MPKRLSKVLGVTRKTLEDKGVFDSTIDFDSRLHIDPALLGKSRIPEFNKAKDKVSSYFTDILRLVKHSKKEGDALWRSALKKLSFGEGLHSSLGYSEKGTAGSGIGPETAERILFTAKEVIDAGVNDPAIFELVPVLEERIGPDRISDMMTIILQEEFISYTNRVASEIGVIVPNAPDGKKIIFIPKSLLSDLPIAEDWDDVQIAAAYNDALREVLNNFIGVTWKKAASKYSKEELRSLLIKNPELLKELLDKYKNRPGNGYDFGLDHLGILLWDILGEDIADRNKIDLRKYGTITPDNILKVVKVICQQYANLIEYNGLVEHLYDSNGYKRPERFPQLLLFAVADSYCKANNLDLSREINNGSGALDFKISQGTAKVTVELKYSKNPKLIEGFEKQLTAYNKAEGVNDKHSIYLVLRINSNQDRKIKQINNLIQERFRQGKESPEFILINAIRQPPASKR